MKRYLVTGGAGFIGSHIVSALLQQGAAVRVLDDFSTGKRQNLEGLEKPAKPGNLQVIEGDIRDAARVAEAVLDVDVIFHEAAFVSVPESIEKPHLCLDVNVVGTSIVFEAARKAGVHRVVIASSAAVYGDSTTTPLAEEARLRPLSPYASSKLADETYAAMYTRAYALEVCALRYFNVYGPRQRPDSVYAAAVPIFIRRLLDGQAITVFGDGRQTRDLIFVGDVVRANLIAAEHPAAAGQVFNICTGQSTRILDLIGVLRELFPGAREPVFAPARAGDIYASLGSPRNAEATIGFKARVSLGEGLRETVEYVR
jgi:nucleoside-diphosphate-sugar epimerase